MYKNPKEFAKTVALLERDIKEMEEQLDAMEQKVKQTRYYWKGESGELFRKEMDEIKKDAISIVKQLIIEIKGEKMN